MATQTNTSGQTKTIKNDKNNDNELLIYGYCRYIQSLLNKFNNTIPEEIIILCLQFFPKAQILTWNETLKSECMTLTDNNKSAHIIGPR